MEAVVSVRGSKEARANLENEDGQAARHVGIAYDSAMACLAAVPRIEAILAAQAGQRRPGVCLTCCWQGTLP